MPQIYKKSKRSLTGFTLVEIIIAVFILAFLTILVVVLLDPAEFFPGARDTRRISDLQAIDSALSMYRQDVGNLFKGPSTATVTTSVSLVRQNCAGYSNCFTSLSAWQAAFGGINFASSSCAQGDLVCANIIAVAQIDGSWTNPDTTPVSIDGWVTDLNHYVKIYTTSSARHQGKWDTNKYRLSGSYEYGVDAMLGVTQSYTKIEGIQVGRSGGTDVMSVVFINRENIELSKLIVKKDGASVTTQGIFVRDTATNFKIWDTLVYDVNDYGISIGAPGFLYNTTIVNSGTYGITATLSAGYNLTLKNVLSKGSVTRDFRKTGAGSMTCYNCASGDATANQYGGNGNRINQTFTFVNEAGKDFHLSASDTGAKEYGVNIYLTDPNIFFQDDIDGDPRGTTWDIGSDQVTPGNWFSSPQAAVGLIRENCAGYSNCFTSLSAWQAAFGGINFGSCAAGNLICANKIAVAQIDGSWINPDATSTAINGWTTDVNRYVKIYTTPTARHGGKWDTTKYRLEGESYWDVFLRIDSKYVKIDGLQISRTGGGGDSPIIYVAGNAGGFELSNSIIRGTSASISAIDLYTNTSIGYKIWNNIIYGPVNNGIMGYGKTFLYNNTIIGANNGVEAISGSDTDWTIKNTLIKGSATRDFYKTGSGAGSMICYNCASEDATANQYGGNGNRINQTFTFVDEVGQDFHLSASDTGAKGYGADLSKDPYLWFNSDIDNELRFKIWDIGADQIFNPISTVFVSLPDTNYDCRSYSLPALPIGMNYYCVNQDNFQKNNSNGWIPVDFTKIPGNTFTGLLIDPENSINNGKYYTFVSDGKKWELTSILESDKNKGPTNIGGKDGGQYDNILEIGSNLTLTPNIVKSRN